MPSKFAWSFVDVMAILLASMCLIAILLSQQKSREANEMVSLLRRSESEQVSFHRPGPGDGVLTVRNGGDMLLELGSGRTVESDGADAVIRAPEPVNDLRHLVAAI